MRKVILLGAFAAAVGVRAADDLPATPRDALIRFYHKLGGDSWLKKDSWTSGTPICSWYGVTCDADNRDSSTVERVILPANNLAGVLADALSPVLLAGLKELTLSKNNLSGPLPTLHAPGPNGDANVAGAVVSPLLEVLALSDNSLTGNFSSLFPMTCPPKLANFTLDRNNVSGSLHDALGACPSLAYISVRRNLLSGSLPQSLFNLKTLSYLDVTANALTGDLPDAFAQLTGLKVLQIARNQFTGALPSSLTSLAAAEVLQLQRNNFTGALPDFSKLSLLRIVYAHNNSLSGQLFSDWSLLKNLSQLNLRDNDIEGSLPVSLPQSLISLDLSLNKFQGAIPGTWSSLVNLTLMDVSSNGLTGPLPEGLFAGMSMIQSIDLSRNHLEGDVRLGSTTSYPFLSTLGLNNNNFTGISLGSLPFTSSFLPSLSSVDAADNNITDASALIEQLSAREIGGLESTVGSYVPLSYLDLSRNAITKLPPSSFTFRTAMFLCGSNKIQGPIPEVPANLQLPQSHILAENPALRLGSLVFIDLSNNNISADVPGSFQSVVDLKVFNLTQNPYLRHANPLTPPFLVGAGGTTANSSSVSAASSYVSFTNSLVTVPAGDKRCLQALGRGNGATVLLDPSYDFTRCECIEDTYGPLSSGECLSCPDGAVCTGGYSGLRAVRG
jgi:hypothetical protein